MTAAEKLRSWVDISITLVTKVGARPPSNGLREDVDKANVDDVQRGLLAEMTQARLVGTLALDRLSACIRERPARSYIRSRQRH